MSDRKIVCQKIEAEGSLFEAVIDLWRKNRKRLGLFPRGAFEETARKGALVGAIDAVSGNLVGYSAFRVAKQRISLTHLCSAKRGLRAGESMITFIESDEELAKLDGIELHCRDDYGLAPFWQSVGFVPAHERDGRGEDGAKLTFWRKRFANSDLFSWKHDQGIDSRLRVAMDTVVFSRATDPDLGAEGDECRALLADWLFNEIHLGHTDEILTELNRDSNPETKRKRRQRLTRFDEFRQNPEATTVNKSKLEQFWPLQRDQNDESDLLHVAKASAADADVFLTLDEKLLERAPNIENSTGLRVLRPLSLIETISLEEDAAAYYPARLEGTKLSIRKVSESDITQIEDTFLNRAAGEKAVRFRARLRATLADQTISTALILSGSSPIAFSAYSDVGESVTFHFLRGRTGSAGRTALIGFLWGVVSRANQSHSAAEIVDGEPSAAALEAIKACGFLSVANGRHIKPILRLVGSRSLCQAAVSGSRYAADSAIGMGIKRFSEALEQAPPSPTHTKAIERRFWPTKLIDPDYPNFVVSIKPNWAATLFDSERSDAELFDRDERRLLNLENVYYRAPSGPPHHDWGRILWYVCLDDQDRGRTGCVRACSTIEEVSVGDASDLYRENRQLGAWKWRDIEKLASENDGRIMAIRFSHTEQLSSPIKPEELGELGIKPPYISPRPISAEQFESAYRSCSIGV